MDAGQSMSMTTDRNGSMARTSGGMDASATANSGVGSMASFEQAKKDLVQVQKRYATQTALVGDEYDMDEEDLC